MSNRLRPHESVSVGWYATEWPSAPCWCRSLFTWRSGSTITSTATVRSEQQIGSAAHCGNSSSQRSRSSPAALSDLSLLTGLAGAAHRFHEQQLRDFPCLSRSVPPAAHNIQKAHSI